MKWMFYSNLCITGADRVEEVHGKIAEAFRIPWAQGSVQ